MVVYFIQAGETAIKIGITDNLNGRLSNLNTGNHEPLKLLFQHEVPSREKAEKIEKELHSYFVDYNIKGEWFKLSPFILSCIEIMKKDGYPAFVEYSNDGMYFEIWEKLSEPIQEIRMVAKDYCQKQNYHALRTILKELDEVKKDIELGHF